MSGFPRSTPCCTADLFFASAAAATSLLILFNCSWLSAMIEYCDSSWAVVATGPDRSPASGPESLAICCNRLSLSVVVGCPGGKSWGDGALSAGAAACEGGRSGAAGLLVWGHQTYTTISAAATGSASDTA